MVLDIGILTQTHAHTHTFNGNLSLTARISWYQKGKTNLNLLQQEIVSGCGVSWAICKCAPCPTEITMQAPQQSVFTGQIPLVPPNQQHESTEGSRDTATIED